MSKTKRIVFIIALIVAVILAAVIVWDIYYEVFSADSTGVEKYYEAEAYEQQMGGGLFTNKGVAVISNTLPNCKTIDNIGFKRTICNDLTKYKYSFTVTFENDKKSPVLIDSSSFKDLEKYLGKSVVLTYGKERVFKYNYIVACQVAPCNPVAAYDIVAVVKSVKEVAPTVK